MPTFRFRTPREVIGAVAEMDECFARVAAQRGLQVESALRLFLLLPDSIRNAPCFLDRITELWRYEYGAWIDGLAGGQVLKGTNIAPPVELLFDVIQAASQRLTASQLATYLKRLTDEGRHQEYLTEFAPILHLPSTTSATYEEPALGDAGQEIDWLIEGAGRRVALEVKYRVVDLITHVKRIQSRDRESDHPAPAPDHDHTLMLRSIESKFRRQAPHDLLQGAWIRTELKQEESEITAAFNRMDEERVHFLVFGDFENDVSIIARTPEISRPVLTCLNVKESGRFLFRRGEDAAATTEP